MASLLCLWLLIFGTYFNTRHIQSIRSSQEDVYVDVPVKTEKYCLPFVDIAGCYSYQKTNKVFDHREDVYTITLSNIWYHRYRRYESQEIKVSNITHPDDYHRISNHLKACA